MSSQGRLANQELWGHADLRWCLPVQAIALPWFSVSQLVANFCIAEIHEFSFLLFVLLYLCS